MTDKNLKKAINITKCLEDALKNILNMKDDLSDYQFYYTETKTYLQDLNKLLSE